MCHSKIWHLRRQKFACPKVDLSFFEKFSKFFGIFNGEIPLFTKSVQKWSSFRKKSTLFFSIIGGGRGIGEYSAKKIYFFPGQQKKLWKTFPIFFTFRSGKFFKIALFGQKLSRFAFFGGKIVKIGNKLQFLVLISFLWPKDLMLRD